VTDDTPTTEQPATEERPPRRLQRSSSDRVLAGVAGGLGRYFRIDPVIFRIGFGISIFFGGIGALAYLLLALLVPTDGEPDLAQRIGGRLQSRGLWRGLAAIVIVLLAAAGLIALSGASAAVVALGWGVPVGIAVIAIGALLAFTALRGGGARWLILPAVAIATGAGVAAASDLDFRGGVGDREYQPLDAAAIPAEGYDFGLGRLVVDLRHLDWRRERVVDLKLRLGAGQANVFVPSGVCVTGTTRVDAGESEVVGERNSGFGVDHSVGAGAGAVPRLQLDAEVEIGQLRVINSDTASVDNPGYGPGAFHEDTAPLRAAEASACGAG
jgi:phage shock protein PspC (stress-responsive transcriptional regulator)